MRMEKQEKDNSSRKENLWEEKFASKATKLRDSSGRDLHKPVNPNDGLAELGELFKDQGAYSSKARHRYSVNSVTEKQRSGYNVAKITSKENEIIILNEKLQFECLEGFALEILPGDYKHVKELSCSESFFSSQEERKALQGKIREDWSSWKTQKGPPCCGVRVSDRVSRDISAKTRDGDKTQRTSKACTAIVTKTSIQQVRKFSVQVKLNKKAVEDAKEILKANIDKQRQAVSKFNNKYCSFVYAGQYSAGGWFQTVATARSKKALEFTALTAEAMRRTERSWLASGGKPGQRRGFPSIRTSNTSERILGYVSVIVREESDPRLIFSERDLEKKIENLRNCIVMPSIGAKKSEFTPVYKIMEKQAETTGDKELQKVAAIVRMYMKGTSSLTTKVCSPVEHYVVLLGDSGTGKSTIVEKLTGEKGRGSNASESFTRTSEPFWVPDGSLIVSDTPGSNSRKDKLENNLSIAGALNFRPVSRIFIVVKAEPRIDSVIDKVCKYADNFEELPFDVVGVLVTHMDMVEWTEDDFISAVDDELGISTVVFSSISTNGEKLLANILKTCLKKHDLTINDENFSKLFKIKNSHRKILQFTSDEVTKFSAKKKAFDEERKCISDKDQVDLAFEFQAYMTDEIVEAKTRMSEQNNFTFNGDNAVIEAGHVINMVNQLHMVLRDIRAECSRYHCEHGVSEFRKCPYCGLVWTNIEGCSGNKICGNRRPAVNDTNNSMLAVLGTFSFKWNGGKLEINKSCEKYAESARVFAANFGCGKTINWKDMATVNVPTVISQCVKACVREKESHAFGLSNLTGTVRFIIRELEERITSRGNRHTLKSLNN